MNHWTTAIVSVVVVKVQGSRAVSPIITSTVGFTFTDTEARVTTETERNFLLKLNINIVL